MEFLAQATEQWAALTGLPGDSWFAVMGAAILSSLPGFSESFAQMSVGGGLLSALTSSEIFGS